MKKSGTMTPGLLRPGGSKQKARTTCYEDARHQSWLPWQSDDQVQVTRSSLKSHQSERRKSHTLSNWTNNLPGKALLLDQLAKLKKKTASQSSSKTLFTGPQGSNPQSTDDDSPMIVVCDFCTQSTEGHEASKEPEWLNSEKSVRFSLPEQTKCDDGKHKESNVSCLKQECQPQVKLGHDFFEEHHRSDVYKNSFQRQNFCQLPGPIGQYSLRRNASYGEGLGDPYTNYQVKDHPCCCPASHTMVPVTPLMCQYDFCDQHYRCHHPYQDRFYPVQMSHCCPINYRQESWDSPEGEVFRHYDSFFETKGSLRRQSKQSHTGSQSIHEKGSIGRQYDLSRLDQSLNMVGSSFTLPRMNHNNKKQIIVGEQKSSTLERRRKPSPSTSKFRSSTLERNPTKLVHFAEQKAATLDRSKRQNKHIGAGSLASMTKLQISSQSLDARSISTLERKSKSASFLASTPQDGVKIKSTLAENPSVVIVHQPEAKKNESGESDPGYESDSINSKNKNKQSDEITVSTTTSILTNTLNLPTATPNYGSLKRTGQQHKQPQELVGSSKSVLVEKEIKRSIIKIIKTEDEPIFEMLEPERSGQCHESEPFKAPGVHIPVVMEIFSPVMLEQHDLAASQTLRAALSKAEASCPGVSYDLVLGLVRKADLQVNVNESLLRLQGALSADQDGSEYKLNRTEEPFQELNKKSLGLKKILTKVPDEIADRKAFLETIREIASAIKKLLDAVNDASAYIPGTSGKQALELKKREFVKYSKKFSNTLKEYFKEGQPNSVYVAATQLIYQTNQLMVTVKKQCE